MKVKEFIELLQTCNQDAVVIAYDEELAQPCIVQGVNHNENFVLIETDKKS